jgi:toxin ParE1/3/4
MRLLIVPSALEDMQGIKAYCRDEGVPEVAQKLLESVFQRAEILLDHPDSGRIVPEFGQHYIRELMQPPFRVVYLREDEVITIVRVWRSERLLPE